MNKSKAPIRIEKASAWQVIKELEAARYALPRLQREFVWDGKRAARLLDSIDRGLPIGSLLIWETSGEKADWLRQSDHDFLPTFNRAHPTVRVIIDGQQRLSVLYQAFRGETKRNAFGTEVNFRRVVLAVGKDDRTDLHFAYRGEHDKAFISVPAILSSSWRSHCRRLKFSSPQIALVDKTRERLRGYPLHLVLFRTHSMDDVSDCFIRINTGGRRLSSSDELLAGAQRFSLREHVRALQRSLEGMDRLPENVLLHGFCFVNGKTRVDKVVARNVIRDWQSRVNQDGRADSKFDDLWNEFARAVQKAANLLRMEFKVHNLDFLPSDNILTTLPHFFYKNGGQDPSAGQLRQIRRWFWATAVGNRYTGSGYRKNIESDIDYFGRLADAPATGFKFRPTTTLEDLRRTAFMGRKSIAKAVFCLLARQKPVNLKTGAAIGVDVVSGRADRKNKHHIFPRALLHEADISSQRTNSIVNICFLPSAFNIEIGKNPPHQYLSECGPKRDLSSRLHSHLIPSSARDALGHRPLRVVFREFLDARSRLIAKEMEKAAGNIRLFAKRND